MLDILLFWASKGIDAFRCDMAEMVPAAFWEWATRRVRKQYKDILFIGEVYNPAEYRHYLASGFDYLYDKVGMYDTMRDVICTMRQRPSAVPGSRLTTSATTCSTSWRTTTSSALPATSLPATQRRPCRQWLSTPCCSRTPSCSMPDRSMASVAWTRRASAATTDAPPSSTTGRWTRFAVLPRRN